MGMTCFRGAKMGAQQQGQGSRVTKACHTCSAACSSRSSCAERAPGRISAASEGVGPAPDSSPGAGCATPAQLRRTAAGPQHAKSAALVAMLSALIGCDVVW